MFYRRERKKIDSFKFISYLLKSLIFNNVLIELKNKTKQKNYDNTFFFFFLNGILVSVMHKENNVDENEIGKAILPFFFHLILFISTKSTN